MKIYSVFRVAAFLFVALIANVSFSQEGPFGLYWGEDASKIKGRNVTLEEQKREGAFAIYTTANVPKSISIAEGYSLIVHDRYGLQKVSLVSKDIANDPSGREGKDTYAQFKRSIAEKYGPASNSVERFGVKLYKEYDEFYQCLKYDGCGVWVTFWDLGAKGMIALQIKGLARGRGFLSLAYEGPNWSRAVDEKDALNSSKDKNAL